MHILERFNKSSKETIKIPRLDNIPMYPAWLVAYGLSYTRCKPEWLVIVGFLLSLISCALLPMMHDVHVRWLIITCLGAIIILDCADGRLARMTGQIRAVGGLGDLASDYIHNVLWHSVIAMVLIQQGMSVFLAVGLSFIGFLGAVFGATLYSYFNFCSRNPSLSPQNFINPLPADTHAMQNMHIYKPLSLVHTLGWGLVADMMLKIPKVQKTRPTELGMQFLAINAAGSNIMIAMFVLAANMPIHTYLYAEALFCIASFIWVVIYPISRHKKAAG